jgi:hypothetical protein
MTTTAAANDMFVRVRATLQSAANAALISRRGTQAPSCCPTRDARCGGRGAWPLACVMSHLAIMERRSIRRAVASRAAVLKACDSASHKS